MADQEFPESKDWRVKLKLAEEAGYFYNLEDAGIMTPLKKTDGVIFPYMPTITIGYRANYGGSNPAHTNYTIYQYNNSLVDSIQIVADFTAQDTAEANYMLAVIHFFKSITKMFYGQDENPLRGTPPPLVYMFGLGEFQFNGHPMAVKEFTYSLPNNVDYIRTTNLELGDTGSATASQSPANSRLPSIGVQKGGVKPRVQFLQPSIEDPTTYVPTKMQMTIGCIPIISRNTISNKFSLRDYASGKLLQGSSNPARGGIW